MKFITHCCLLMSLLISCKDHQKDAEPVIPQTVQEEPQQKAFFPVTDFIKGQVTEIREKGVNPVKIIVSNGHTDSSWVKSEQLEKEFEAFLTPVIDSINLAGKFNEKTFLDQTVNAFTLTYDPAGSLPDSFPLQRWDVYVDPQKNTVRRIYMVKKTADHKTLQLTWQADNWCKMVTIAEKNGAAYIEKEVTIKWDF